VDGNGRPELTAAISWRRSELQKKCLAKEKKQRVNEALSCEELK
jgi:hypothetical protein